MNTALIDARIDSALAKNARAEKIFLAFAAAIFVFGLVALVVSYWKVHPVVGASASVVQAMLIWPMTEIRRLRRENISLQTVPVLVASMPPARAADEIGKVLAYVRGEQPEPPAPSKKGKR